MDLALCNWPIQNVCVRSLNRIQRLEQKELQDQEKLKDCDAHTWINTKTSRMTMATLSLQLQINKKARCKDPKEFSRMGDKVAQQQNVGGLGFKLLVIKLLQGLGKSAKMKCTDAYQLGLCHRLHSQSPACFSPTAIAAFPQSSCRYFCYDLTDTFSGKESWKEVQGSQIEQPVWVSKNEK